VVFPGARCCLLIVAFCFAGFFLSGALLVLKLLHCST
jgi:hypothetical protein